MSVRRLFFCDKVTRGPVFNALNRNKGEPGSPRQSILARALLRLIRAAPESFRLQFGMDSAAFTCALLRCAARSAEQVRAETGIVIGA